MFSTTWAMQYWYLCAIALLIGIVTGWWIWARLRAKPELSVSRAVDQTPVATQVVDPIPTPAAAPLPLVEGGPRIAAAVGAPDDLELIKGVGPALNALLNRLGVRRFDQIAAWTAADIAEVDGHMEAFKGRISRDNWVDQASYLARGDTAGFEAKYGELGSEKNRI